MPFSRKMSGKTLFFVIVFLFVATWVPCLEATLYWNILWDVRNLKQWDRNSGPLQQVKVEKPVVLALSRDLGMKNFKIACLELKLIIISILLNTFVTFEYEMMANGQNRADFPLKLKFHI